VSIGKGVSGVTAAATRDWLDFGLWVAVASAIVEIDLADRKQAVVVCDRDSTVLARKTLRCKAWDLGADQRAGEAAR